ncbi:hypothetical protein SAMN05660206_11332 [Sphingobacterium wenxiniae]|uniref:Uncharacterized protein n=1 Tax=Sphingobacterium wenxiniae TaxID=683125 RepID=A0A1I6VEA5_9SPHI|nr:hypothetical protein SAMN05660206_11332 [Sphingobacterium wenxiniae]
MIKDVETLELENRIELYELVYDGDDHVCLED